MRLHSAVCLLTRGKAQSSKLINKVVNALCIPYAAHCRQRCTPSSTGGLPTSERRRLLRLWGKKKDQGSNWLTKLTYYSLTTVLLLELLPMYNLLLGLVEEKGGME